MVINLVDIVIVFYVKNVLIPNNSRCKGIMKFISNAPNSTVYNKNIIIFN